MPAASQTNDLHEVTVEYNACWDSVAYFLNNYARIADPQAGITPFRLWGFQRELLETFEAQQRVIVLKARQLGVSWLMAGYALWTAMFQEGANVLMLSKRLDEAVSLLDKCEHIYTHLPPWLQPKLGKRNETTLQFAKRGSKITALPATEDAGRSESASLVIVDEAAFHPAAEANYAAYKPTVDAGGKLLIVSTANGRGNWYHQMWTGAPQNGFVPVFLPWSLRPGRTAEWWERQQQEYAATPRLLAQEYPQNAAEAFIASGNCLFDVAAIQRQLEGCRQPLETRLNGALKIWSRPVVGRVYVAGADVAEGIDAGNDRLDYSGVAIYDWQTCVHVADLHGQWPVDIFAAEADKLAREFNNALLGVERNNHGHAVLLVLQQLGFPNLYRHNPQQDDLKARHSAPNPQAGWPTTRVTKPIMEQELAALVSSGGIISYDTPFWDECLSYVQHGDGKTGAQSGCHDDRVVKHMIALQMRRFARPSEQGIVRGHVRIGGRR